MTFYPKTRPDSIPAAWQRPARPQRRVTCCACLQPARLRDTVPLWDERLCLDCLSVDDRRLHRTEFGGSPNARTWHDEENR